MLLRSVAAAALAVAGICVSSAASAAPADNPVATQGVIGGDYMYTSYNHGFGHTDTYGGEVGGIVPFASEWSGQLSGGYHAIDLSGGGPTFDDWNVEGTISYDKPWGRLGANVGYNGLSGGGGHVNVTNYGVYGLYYPNAQWTLGLRGGGLTGDLGAFGFGANRSGGYVGGQVAGYAMPNLELKAGVEWAGVSDLNQTTASVRGEYLVSQTTPVSVWLGYDYTNVHVSGFGSEQGNGVSIGLKYYFGGMPATLVDRRRSGVDDFGPRTINIISF